MINDKFAPKTEEHSGVIVLRDDLIFGTKSVYLDDILPKGEAGYVYASPAFGGFQVSLSKWAAENKTKAFIFIAKRKELSEFNIFAKRLGGRIFGVPLGFLTNVQAKAREFAAANGFYYIDFGGGYGNKVKNALKKRFDSLGKPDINNIVVAVGSGIIATALANAMPDKNIIGVCVGGKIKTGEDIPKNLNLYESPYKFENVCKTLPPFPSSKNYDAKAWEWLMQNKESLKGETLFWNVL